MLWIKKNSFVRPALRKTGRDSSPLATCFGVLHYE
jgi:hypothetical protein